MFQKISLQALIQSSQTHKCFCTIGSFWEKSVTRKVFDAIVGFFDRLGSGSLFIFWVTGRELSLRPITRSKSFFSQKLEASWEGFLKNISNANKEGSSLSRSRYIPILLAVRSVFAERPLWVVGWLGSAFFSVYGIFSLVVVGISLRGLLLVFAMFCLSILLTMTKGTLKDMIEASWIIKWVDSLDE
ncbi:MAG: hypothetical protein BWX90_01531 [bacterium ADurb.Bin132]|nr:MAG: hypothetical protein BWX90_01531 [bacterium ADurb.Bin132]